MQLTIYEGVGKTQQKKHESQTKKLKEELKNEKELQDLENVNERVDTWTHTDHDTYDDHIEAWNLIFGTSKVPDLTIKESQFQKKMKKIMKNNHF